MVVVTSPSGDQAPPALAAMTVIPAKKQSLIPVRNKFAQQRYNDNGGSQVIEDCREEKGDQCDHPEQFIGILGFYPIGNDLKTIVGVNQFHDGHGTEQKKQNTGYFAQMFHQLVGNGVFVGLV